MEEDRIGTGKPPRDKNPFFVPIPSIQKRNEGRDVESMISASKAEIVLKSVF